MTWGGGGTWTLNNVHKHRASFNYLPFLLFNYMDIKTLENMHTFTECIHTKMRRIGIKNKTVSLTFWPRPYKRYSDSLLFYVHVLCLVSLIPSFLYQHALDIGLFFRYFTYHRKLRSCEGMAGTVTGTRENHWLIFAVFYLYYLLPTDLRREKLSDRGIKALRQIKFSFLLKGPKNFKTKSQFLLNFDQNMALFLL